MMTMKTIGHIPFLRLCWCGVLPTITVVLLCNNKSVHNFSFCSILLGKEARVYQQFLFNWFQFQIKLSLAVLHTQVRLNTLKNAYQYSIDNTFILLGLMEEPIIIGYWIEVLLNVPVTWYWFSPATYYGNHTILYDEVAPNKGGG